MGTTTQVIRRGAATTITITTAALLYAPHQELVPLPLPAVN